MAGNGHGTSVRLAAGFTLVELLIVIVVIAILAAITIVAYRGVQNRANDSVVQENLSDFAKSIELYKAENGHYPDGTSGSLNALAAKITTGSYDTTNYNFYYCTNKSDNSAYALAARSKSGHTYYVSSQGSGQLGTVIPTWQASCGVIDYTVLDDVTFNYSYDKSIPAWRYGT